MKWQMLFAIFVAGILVASIFPANVNAAVDFSEIENGEPLGEDDSQSTGHLPNIPSNPHPPDGANDVGINVTLSWSGGDKDGDAVTYDIYLEANDDTPDVKIASVTTTSYLVKNLEYGTVYYWRVGAKDKDGSVLGPVWKFVTVGVETVRVAIYNVSELENDTGSKLKCMEKWINSDTYGMIAALDVEDIWTYNGKPYRFEYDLIKYKDIVDGKLNTENYKLFIAPGDYDYFVEQWKNRSTNAHIFRENIRTFVDNGGGYIGTCAGASLACSGRVYEPPPAGEVSDGPYEKPDWWDDMPNLMLHMVDAKAQSGFSPGRCVWAQSNPLRCIER